MGLAKQVYSWKYAKQFVLVLFFINYFIIYLHYSCKPTFANPCMPL